MNKVKFENSDGVLWYIESTIIDLVDKIQQGPVTVDLCKEGPDCQLVGLDTVLDQLVEKLSINPASILIETSNQLKSSKYKEHRLPFVEWEYVQQKALTLSNNKSTLLKRFGFFVSRSNWLRLALASYINYYYADKTIMTYHYDPTSDYHNSHFGLEELFNRHREDIDVIAEFIKQLPMRPMVYKYPILWNEHALDLDDYYQDLFCDVICESYFSGRVFFMTEKTMRAIAHRRPFIVQGPQWYLKNLKKLGFQTFSQWWDEGYDEDPWDFKYQALKYNIDYIAKQPVETIQRWYQEMQPVLDHNYNTFINLTSDQILQTEFYYHE
jgi:hypothetical protein